MQNRSCGHRRSQALLAALAGIGRLHWFFGNLYEAAVAA